jgi:tRNA(fMet)-specific endonuclease VapC
VTWLLDTDILVHFLRGHTRVTERITAVPSPSLAMPAIALAELSHGAFASDQVEANLRLIDTLRRRIRVLPFEDEAAVLFGRLKASLKSSGNILPDSDLFIAATALVTGRVLVTANTTHFQRLEGLILEDWTR